MAKPAAVLLFASLLASPAWAGAEPTMPPFPSGADEGATMLWLRANTRLGVGRFVAFGPDNVVVVLTDEVSTRTPSLHQVSFRQEATKLDFVSRTGGRSVRGAGEINCATGTFRAETLELYSGSDLRGDRITSEGPETVARTPRPGSAAAVAVAEVCAGDGSALAPLASTARAAPSRPATAPVPPLPDPPRPPSAGRVGAPAPAAPSSLAAIDATLEPPPAPRARPGEVLAQIGAFGTMAGAEEAWTRLAAAFPDDFAGKGRMVEPITVNGVAMYRSAVVGFATPAEADRLCARLMASSEACFVRRGR